MREISGLAKFGYFCVGLFGGLFACWPRGSGQGRLGLERGRQAVRVIRLPVLVIVWVIMVVTGGIATSSPFLF